MKKYALYTRKLGVYGGCWLFSSNLVLSAKSDSQVSVGHFLFSAQISQFCFSKHQALPCAILSGYLWKKKRALNPDGWC